MATLNRYQLPKLKFGFTGAYYWKMALVFGAFLIFFDYDLLYHTTRGYFDVIYLPARLLGLVLVALALLELFWPSRQRKITTPNLTGHVTGNI